MQPVPGHGISTAYGIRGKHWSCNANASGGVHTGADFAAPQGTQIVAPISGQIRWRNYGAAFGSHQFAISPDLGQPFAEGEVFFAHTTTRPKDGSYVKAGDPIAKVGAEGNVTGPHLHMEYHATTKGVWNCNVHNNPQPVIDWKDSPAMKSVYAYKYSGKPGKPQALPKGTYVKLDSLDTPDPTFSGLEFKMLYLNISLEWPTAGGVGNARVKYVREGGDATAYQDFALNASQDSFLLTHMHMETGEKDKGGIWWVKLTGDMKDTSVIAESAYSKWAEIRKDLN